jgi:hypothetical protein
MARGSSLKQTTGKQAAAARAIIAELTDRLPDLGRREQT